MKSIMEALADALRRYQDIEEGDGGCRCNLEEYKRQQCFYCEASEALEKYDAWLKKQEAPRKT